MDFIVQNIEMLRVREREGEREREREQKSTHQQNQKLYRSGFLRFSTNFRNKSTDIFYLLFSSIHRRIVCYKLFRQGLATKVNKKIFDETNILYRCAALVAFYKQEEKKEKKKWKENEEQNQRIQTHSRTFSIIRSEKLPSETTISYEIYLVLYYVCSIP